MDSILGPYDIVLTAFYLILTIIFSLLYQNKRKYFNPEYKYFTIGILIKIFGGIAVGLIYNFYYKGGDTINYFITTKAYLNLFDKSPNAFFEGWFSNLSFSDYFYFNETTGYPVYYPKDSYSFFVVRLEIPLVFLGMQSYFPSALLTAIVCYSGTWKLYQTYILAFPNLKKELAIATLFVPSVAFWGSGIMKDSFALSAVGWYTYSFYNSFILNKKQIHFYLFLLISSFLILSIKPYIFFAILPGSIIWLSRKYLLSIKNLVIKFILAPAILTISLITSFWVLESMGDNLGKYKIDSVIQKAVITQKDMRAEYYNGNSFDIGTFEPNAAGVIKKIPIAVFSGLYRPTLIEVKNPVMLLSSLENTFFLFLSIFLLIKLNFKGVYFVIEKNPIILFSLLFSLFFSFSIGLSVSNYGSLVRLRIPAIPFFIASLYILKDSYNRSKKSAIFSEPMMKYNQ